MWAYRPVSWINLIPFSTLTTDKLQIATGKFTTGSLRAFSSICSVWSGKCLQQQMNIRKISLFQYGFSLYTCINSVSFTDRVLLPAPLTHYPSDSWHMHNEITVSEIYQKHLQKLPVCFVLTPTLDEAGCIEFVLAFLLEPGIRPEGKHWLFCCC